jgi:hypothetical protein
MPSQVQLHRPIGQLLRDTTQGSSLWARVGAPPQAATAHALLDDLVHISLTCASHRRQTARACSTYVVTINY